MGQGDNNLPLEIFQGQQQGQVRVNPFGVATMSAARAFTSAATAVGDSSSILRDIITTVQGSLPRQEQNTHWHDILIGKAIALLESDLPESTKALYLSFMQLDALNDIRNELDSWVQQGITNVFTLPVPSVTTPQFMQFPARLFRMDIANSGTVAIDVKQPYDDSGLNYLTLLPATLTLPAGAESFTFLTGRITSVGVRCTPPFTAAGQLTVVALY